MKRIITCVCAAVMGMTLLTGCAKETPEMEIQYYGYDELDEDPIVISNDNLELTFDAATTSFQVLDKKTGTIWYSGAEDSSADTKAAASQKKVLDSTLILQYATSAGDTKTLNNNTYSVETMLYEYEVSENTITVRYTIGDLQRTYYIPPALTETQMNAYKEGMESSIKIHIDDCYRRYDINNLREGDDREALLEKYPELATERVFVLRDTAKEHLKAKIETAMLEAGYTKEQYEIDAERYGVSVQNDKPAFNVTVVYRLEEDGLVVEVPYEEIRYKRDYPLVRLKVLPYFGCGSETDEGYLFVPDGSGAIMNFNSGKTGQTAYYSNVYGWDWAQNRDALVNENTNQLPVFGISRNGSSMICVLEDGASYAAIEADIAGRLHNQNYVCANYLIIHSEQMDISSKSDSLIFAYEETLPQETLRQKYVFCEADGYVEMAKTYREYLQSQYADYLTKIEATGVPVVVDVLGAVTVVKQIAGVPTDAPEALTTYDEAAELINKLSEQGWTDLAVRYRGWFNQGLDNEPASAIKLIGELGSKSDFKSLISTAKEKNVTLFFDGEFQFVHGNRLLDGYVVNRDSVKLVSDEVAELYPYSSVWYGEVETKELYYLARPSVTKTMINTFTKYLSDMGVKNYSLGSIGTSLGADYNEKKAVSREANRKLQEETLKALLADGAKVITDGGNQYATIYSDYVVDAPNTSQKFSILDAEVPFYSLVFHGVINTSGKALNLAEDYQTNLLKAVESGSALYFVFMMEDVATLQETEYTHFFGANYSMWAEVANEVYQKFDAELSHVYNQYIVDHQILEDGLTMTVYEDGTKAIVNYNYTDCTYEGQTVGARDYIVVKGGN